MKVLVFTICFLSMASLDAQNTANALPRMSDWFLASDDWQNAPQLYVREYGAGNGETIIMLHGGWGGDHQGLIESVKDLADGFRFVFYDQRGSLRSPFPDSLITFDNHIEDLERLRIELELEKLTIVGHSMGAVLASAYASKYPKRINKLILLAPAYLKNPIPKEEIELLNDQRKSQQKFMNRSEATNQLEKYSLNGASSSLSSREQTAIFRINFARRMLYDITKWHYLTGGRAIYQGHVFGLTEASYPKNGWDYLTDFQKYKFPVSIIAGDHDFLDFGNGLISKWVKGITNIKLTTVAKAGHIIWIDQPEVFTSELRQALSK